MHVFLVRHAMPLSSAECGDADPPLSPIGTHMAQRLPDALERHKVTRIVSSPQLRAKLTAQPLANALKLPVEIDERLAEYDYGSGEYISVEQMRAADPQRLERLVSGELPNGVDADAFVARVTAATDDLQTTGGQHDRIAMICHGGVINILLRQALD